MEHEELVNTILRVVKDSTGCSCSRKDNNVSLGFQGGSIRYSLTFNYIFENGKYKFLDAKFCVDFSERYYIKREDSICLQYVAESVMCTDFLNLWFSRH